MIEAAPNEPLLVLAMDTSTDMLACAVAHWTPSEDGLSAHIEVLASGDDRLASGGLCRGEAALQEG